MSKKDLERLQAAYDELRNEYADYRNAVRAAVTKVVDATQRGNIMTPPWVEDAIQDLRTMRAPRATESGTDREISAGDCKHVFKGGFCVHCPTKDPRSGDG